MLTLAATSILILFISASLPAITGELSVPLAVQNAPLNAGFRLMFDISENAATALTIPATYATAFGFIYSYGKLMNAV